MGRIDHAAVKRPVLCVLLPVYRSGGKLPTETVLHVSTGQDENTKGQPVGRFHRGAFVADMCKVYPCMTMSKGVGIIHT